MVGSAADNNDHSDGGFDSLEHPGGPSSLRRVRHLARASDTVIPETDAALGRIRERLNDGDESPAARAECAGPPRSRRESLRCALSACLRSILSFNCPAPELAAVLEVREDDCGTGYPSRGVAGESGARNVCSWTLLTLWGLPPGSTERHAMRRTACSSPTRWTLLRRSDPARRRSQ